jgi:hypothetical protein
VINIVEQVEERYEVHMMIDRWTEFSTHKSRNEGVSALFGYREDYPHGLFKLVHFVTTKQDIPDEELIYDHC